MFFIFSKLLAFIISPLIWVLLLLLWSLFSKNAQRKRKLLIASIAISYIFSNSFLFDTVMRQWETKAKHYSELKKYDVGIVLGGMLWYDGQYDRVQFNRSIDRLMQSIELYKRGYIKKILITSGSGSILHPDLREAIYAKRFLLTLEIPEEDILIESESNNTHENALFTKRLLDKEMPKASCLLITSAFHMRRSLGCFAKVGMKVDDYSTDRYSGPRKWEFDYLFIPNTFALQNWQMLIHEMIGYIVYKISGYV